VSETVSIVVKQIEETIALSNKALSIAEIAAELGLNPQTIRNNIKLAINRGTVRKTDFRVGRAEYFESTSKPGSYLPSVQWGEETVPLRDLMFSWSRKGQPNGFIPRQISNIIVALFQLSADFYDENTKNNFSTNTKDLMLKEQRINLVRIQKHLRDMMATCSSLLTSDHLWDYRELIKHIIIRDEEIDIETIRSLIDMINEKTNPL
jgi:DNA-binding Lrp family transcriptional regulator